MSLPRIPVPLAPDPPEAVPGFSSSVLENRNAHILSELEKHTKSKGKRKASVLEEEGDDSDSDDNAMHMDAPMSHSDDDDGDSDDGDGDERRAGSIGQDMWKRL